MSSDEPTMKFYDADGKPTSEAKAVVQYLSDDPARPDAAKSDAKAKTSSDGDKAVKAPAETKAKTGPDESK